MSIQLDHIHFTYFEDRKDLLPGFSASFSSSEITVLTGASGCGKSTLLYLAAGIYPHGAGILREGTVRVEGEDPAKLTPPRRCALVGMMFQNPELQFCMDTVKNELVFCLENICMDPADMDGVIDEALEFSGIPHLKERTLISLSGGERQKVMLACLMALRPKWLLLDEPFANIDDRSARTIAAKLKEMNRVYGTGILAVDHRLDNWLEAADTIRVMEDGQLRPEVMTPDSLDPDVLESLGVIVPGHSYRPDIPPVKEGKTVLTLEHLSVHHKNEPILTDVTAAFKAGHIYAIVGPSGCGKSTLFGALSGIFPYKGKAFLEGKDLKKLKKADLGKIGFVTQNPQDQFVADTVRDEIMVGLKDKDTAPQVSEQVLRGIRLWRYRDISPYMLSQGQQRRLGVAALMAYDCHMLVCDEPTYAQDRRNTKAIMDGLCSQARERGVALLFSTHDRQLAADYADEIWELKEGSLHAFHQSGH